MTPSERRVWLLTPSRALVDVVLAGTSGEPAAEPATYEGWVLTGAHRQLLEHLLETLVAPGPPHKRIDDTGGEAAGHIARLGAPEPV